MKVKLESFRLHSTVVPAANGVRLSIVGNALLGKRSARRHDSRPFLPTTAFPCWALPVALLLLFVGHGAAAPMRQATLLGPLTLQKEPGQSLKVSRALEVSIEGRATMLLESHLSSPPDGGEINLNGVSVVSSAELCESDTVARSVDLRSGTNEIALELTGQSGGTVFLTVLGERPLVTNDVWITSPKWGQTWNADIYGSDVIVNFDWSGTTPTAVELYVMNQVTGVCSTGTKNCTFSLDGFGGHCTLGIQLKAPIEGIWTEPVGFYIKGAGIPACTPKCNSCRRQDGMTAGGPVDVTDGEMFYEVTDFALSGPFPITFSRFNSSTSTYAGPLGYGWHHSFDMWLEFPSSDAGSHPKSAAYVVNTEGQRVTFTKMADYSYAADPYADYFPNPIFEQELRYSVCNPPSDCSGCPTCPNCPTVTEDPPPATCTLTVGQYRVYDYRSGRVYSFSQQADGVFRLRSVKNQGNLLHLLEYDTNATRSRLSTIHYFDSAMSFNGNIVDKGLSFGYNAQGRISSVTTIIEGKSVSFGYDGIGNLTSMTDQRGKTWIYEYADGARPHALTGVKNPLGQYVETHTYDTVDGKPRALTSGKHDGIELLTFAYGSPGANQTTVTDARGKSTVYTYDPAYQGADGEQLGLVTDIAGPGCGCGGGQHRSMTWNSFRHKTSQTDAANHVTKFVYQKFDRIGQLLDPATAPAGAFEMGPLYSRIDAFSEPASERTTRYQTWPERAGGYHLWNDYYLVWRIREPSVDTAGQEAATEFDYQKVTASNCSSFGCYWGCETVTSYYYSDKIRETRTGYSLGSSGSSQTYSWCSSPPLHPAYSFTGPGETTTWCYNQYSQVTRIDGPRTDIADVTSFSYGPYNTEPYSGFDPWYDSLNYCWSTVASNKGQGLQLRSVTDASGNVTSFGALGSENTWDPYGSPRKTVDPNGVVTLFTFDNAGLKISESIQGTPAYTTGYTYDHASRLTDIALPRGNYVHYEWDGASRQTDEERRPDATTKAIRRHRTFDLMSNLTKEELQRWTGSAWASDFWRDMTYDDYNRLQRETPANPLDANEYTEYLYEPRGMISSIKDNRHPKDGSTPTVSYTYDALGRIDLVTQRLSPSPAVTDYDFDTQNHLVKVTDARSNVTTYRVDDFGDNRQTVSPFSGTWNYTFDKGHNPVTIVDSNGSTETRTFDALNRNLTQSYAGAASLNVSRTWDGSATVFGKGRFATMTDASGSSSYEYERRGLPTKIRWVTSATTYDLLSTYNANGELETRTYPDGRLLVYGYDLLDRPTTLTATVDGIASTTVVSDATYLPFGPLASIRFGSAPGEDRTYDSRLRITGLFSGPSLNLTYGSDREGNITGITDWNNSSNSLSLAYDEMGRLTTANGPWGGSSGYTWDPIGNRMTKNEGAGTSVTYVHDSTGKRLLSWSGTESGVAAYDGGLSTGNGDMTSDGTNVFTIGQNHHMLSVGPGPLLGNTFDGDGFRRIRVTPTDTRRQIYLPTGELAAEHNATTGQWVDHLWFGDRLVARVVPGAGDLDLGPFDANSIRVEKSSGNPLVSWSNGSSNQTDLHRDTGFTFLGNSQRDACAAGASRSFADTTASGSAYSYEAFRCTTSEKLEIFRLSHLGTPVRITDMTGALVWTAELRPFGDIWTQAGAGTPVRFPGQYDEAVAGIADNHWRSYAPRLGRYLAVDPLTFMTGPDAETTLRMAATPAYAYSGNDPISNADPSGLVCKVYRWSDPSLGGHAWLENDDVYYGFYPVGGMTCLRGGLGWTKGFAKYESSGTYGAGKSDTYERKDTFFKDGRQSDCCDINRCMDDFFQETKPDGRRTWWLFGYNCRDWADEALRRCGLTTSPPRGPFDRPCAGFGCMDKR